MGNMAEVRTLSLHPMAIHMFIKAQAGSLGKALSEAVMNSIDAYASSVDVTLTTRGFTVTDNGQGFQDKTEIAAWFETLGFPHDEGNHRVYGKFGMGRAQMWAFASTVWSSNQFIMKVDVKNKGLDYELFLNDSPIQGTKIEAVFYEPLSLVDLQRTETELLALVKFVPGFVTLNDKRANKDPTTEIWDLETKDAFLRFDPKGQTLDVYNAGLLVSNFPKYRYGCAGVIVTKTESPLSLNIARNSILEAECTVWRTLKKLLPEAKKPTKKAGPDRASPSTMDEIGQEVSAGRMTLEEAMVQYPGIVTTVHGRAVCYRDLEMCSYKGPIVFVPKGDEFGKTLSKLKLAVVLSSEVLERFDCITGENFKELVRVSVDTRNDYGFEARIFSTSPKDIFPQLASGKTIYAFSELNLSEKAAIAAWQRAFGLLKRELMSVGSEDQQALLKKISGVSLGHSAEEMSWVDEASGSWVFRKRDLEQVMRKSLVNVTKFAMKELSQFCESISETTEEGQNLFIKVITQTNTAGTLIFNLGRFYVNECRSKELPLPVIYLEELDIGNVHEAETPVI